MNYNNFNPDMAKAASNMVSGMSDEQLRGMMGMMGNMGMGGGASGSVAPSFISPYPRHKP